MVKDPQRMAPFWVLTLACLAAIWAVYPQQLGVMLNKLAILAGAGLLAYWLDRVAFYYSRPHEEVEPLLRAAAYIRRAIIMAGAMNAAALAI